MAQLHDLDELSQTVIHRISRRYVDEAIASYRAGAYRAAIGITWVAVCADVIEKLRELSSLGDLEARAKSDQFDKILASQNVTEMLSFERDLLEVACDKLELISTNEKRLLERIREDRNRAVHPSFHDDGTQLEFLPETVRVHIVNACIILFSVPPTKGKVVVQSIFELICEGSFPKTVNDAHKVLSSRSHLERAKDSTKRNLLIVLLKRLFVDDEAIPQSLAEAIAAALGAIERISPELTKIVLAEKLNPMLSTKVDLRLMRAIAIVSMLPTYWGRLDLALRTRIRGVIENMTASEISKYRVVQVAENTPELRECLLAAIESMNKVDRRKVLSLRPAKFLLKLAIVEFSSAGSFDAANLMSKSMIIPLASLFETDDVVELFDQIQANQKYSINQVLSASDTDDCFAEIAKNTVSKEQRAKEAWAGIYSKLSEEGYEFFVLRQRLIEDGAIKEEQFEVDSDEEEEEIPF